MISCLQAVINQRTFLYTIPHRVPVCLHIRTVYNYMYSCTFQFIFLLHTIPQNRDPVCLHTVRRRKIRLIESNAKRRYLK